MDSIYFDPTQDELLSEEELHKKAIIRKYMKIQPLWQFALLCVVSFGLYELYWFYRQWKFIKEYERDEEIMPFWRGIFVLFFGYNLFNTILYSAQKKDYDKSYDSGLVLVAFLVLNALYRLPEPYFIMSFLSFVPLLPVVQAQNYFFAQQKGADRVQTSFTPPEILVILVGVCFLSLMTLGLLMDAGVIAIE